MRRIGWFGAMVAVLGASASAQEDLRETMRKGLEASARGGALRIEGEATSESPLGRWRVQLPGWEGGIEGSFKVAIGTNGAMVVKVEDEKGSTEVFKKGDRLVQRQTWVGRRSGTGGFAREVTSIAMPANLLRHLDGAKEFKSLGERRIGDVDCRGVQAVFPVGLISQEKDEALHWLPQLFELGKVQLVVWLGKEDSRVRRIECKLSKGVTPMLRLGPTWGEEEGEGEEGLGFRSFTNSYTLTITAYEPDVEVKFPPEIAKLFQE